MYVIFEKDGKELVTTCFYEDEKKQSNLMARKDIDDQVKEWQKTNIGNPPHFYSRIRIKEFTNRNLKFSNIKQDATTTYE